MNDCEKQRILDMINKNKKCRRTCFGPTGSKGEQGEVGPTGPQGIPGISETIEIGEQRCLISFSWMSTKRCQISRIELWLTLDSTGFTCSFC